VAFLRFSLAPTTEVFLLSVFLCAQRNTSSPGDTTRAYEDPFELPKYFIRLHPKLFLSISLISYSPVDASPAHEVSPPCQGRLPNRAPYH
jgi:hypothetical protein